MTVVEMREDNEKRIRWATSAAKKDVAEAQKCMAKVFAMPLESDADVWNALSAIIAEARDIQQNLGFERDKMNQLAQEHNLLEAIDGE